MFFIGYLLVTSANAYPTNTVSTANNPIFAFGGQTAASSTSTLATAPSDQKMIITDIVITMSGRGNQSDPCSNRVSIQTGIGNVAEFMLVSDTFYGDYYLPPTQVSHSYRSGIPIEPNDSFGITNHGGYCSISYSISGYYAKP